MKNHASGHRHGKSPGYRTPSTFRGAVAIRLPKGLKKR